MKAFTTVKGAERHTKGHYVVAVTDEFGAVVALSSVPAGATIRIWKHDPAASSVRTEQRELRVSDAPFVFALMPVPDSPPKVLTPEEEMEARLDAEAEEVVARLRNRRAGHDENGGL